jgi:hypothetical protein
MLAWTGKSKIMYQFRIPNVRLTETTY